MTAPTRSPGSTEHTPVTWHVNAIDTNRGRIVGDETATEHFDKLQIHGANRTVATVYHRADARLIADAVNSHAALLSENAALRAALGLCAAALDECANGEALQDSRYWYANGFGHEALEAARAALSAVGESES